MECSQQLADVKIVEGCSKRPSSKAAGESNPEAYPLGYVEDFDEPRTMHGKRRVLARRGWVGGKDGFFSILLEVSCLHHIFNAINVEPVACRVEHSDGILPFQQFLEQLGDACLAVSWLGQQFRNDAGDECGGAG